MKRKLILILSAICMCASLVSCSSQSDASSEENQKVAEIVIPTINKREVGEANTFIKLQENIQIEGTGATVENNKITITSAGTYSISGSLQDGQIIVNADKEDDVYIILNGVNITCSNSAPIYIKSAKNTIIALAENTQNVINDGEQYVLEDEAENEPNAAIFSKDDLIFIGTGLLEVNAKYNNGITSKDDLEIQGGNITVNAVNDGIRGKDSIAITDGQLVIKADGDGMKSNNTEDIQKGYIYIANGKIDITAGEDGIQAETNAIVGNGDIKINSGGGSENSSSNNNWGKWGMNKDFPNGENQALGNMQPPDGERPQAGTPPTDGNQAATNVQPPIDKQPSENNNQSESTEETASAKGIKASSNVVIYNGNIEINSSDDSLHSNNNLIIDNGILNLTSGDDGIHSDATLEINNGKINITKSYEGIESEVITINGGEISLIASDDGINAAGGNDGSSVNGRPGENKFAGNSNASININGGYVYIDASGDGLDANGSIYMKDGTVIVNGPSNNGNGSLDYDGDCEVSGGLLVAAGSAGMAQAPGKSSSQNSVAITVSQQAANTILHVEDENGESILTFAPSKQYQSVVISSPSLKKDSNYNVYVGGEATGTLKNGLYTESKYSNGNKVLSFKISDVVTNATQEGVSTGGNKGGFPGGNMQNGEKPAGGKGNMGRNKGAGEKTDN